MTFKILEDGEYNSPDTNKILFRTANEFSQYIVAQANENDDSITQTLLNYCEDRDVDPEEIAKLISKPLKDRLEIEMQESGLLKRETTARFE